MDRKGLLIALVVALLAGLIFGLMPDLDLRLSAPFYDPGRRLFPLDVNPVARMARDLLQTIPWLFFLPALATLLIKLIWPPAPMLMSGRAAVFLVVTFLIVPGLLSNGVFKETWNRPRPDETVQFNGKLAHVPWWDPRGRCEANCSFFSGEASAAFWTYAPAALTPPPLRPLAYGAATALGLTTGLWRVAFGRHFVSDVIGAGVVAFLVVWLIHGLIFRWPRTRWREGAVEAQLMRFGLPGHNALRRLLGWPPFRPGNNAPPNDGDGAT